MWENRNSRVQWKITAGSDKAHDGDELCDPRVPVTVLTGFLGSNRTTLLNHILTQQRQEDCRDWRTGESALMMPLKKAHPMRRSSR